MKGFNGSPIERQVLKRIENNNAETAVDSLLADFPEELRSRLEEEIRMMDDQVASDYLVAKLIERKKALIHSSINLLPKSVEIQRELPLAVARSIEEAEKVGASNELGAGQSARVLESVRSPNACYKVLYLERSRELLLDIVKEATLQYQVGELLSANKAKVRVPKVYCFIDHERVRAIMMEKIKGKSILEIMRKGENFPTGFDTYTFFSSLEEAILIMNENGYFHRDLMENAGNVIVDEGGVPWLIDYGSAVHSVDPDLNPLTYQITPGGKRHMGNDLLGLRELRLRVQTYINKKENPS